MIIKLTNGDFGSTLQQQTKKILNIQMWIQKNMVSTLRFILSSYLNMPAVISKPEKMIGWNFVYCCMILVWFVMVS